MKTRHKPASKEELSFSGTNVWTIIRDVGTSMCLSASAITWHRCTTDLHRRDSNTGAESTSPKVRHLHGKLPRNSSLPQPYTQIAALCPEAAEMLLRTAPTTPRCGLSILLAVFFLSVGTIAKSQGDWNRSCSAPIKIAGPRGWSALVHSLLPLLLSEWETTVPKEPSLSPMGHGLFKSPYPASLTQTGSSTRGQLVVLTHRLNSFPLVNEPAHRLSDLAVLSIRRRSG
ncbi:hypothetical protein V8E51_014638 [Hyaloscypha variabilis]